MQKIIQKDLQTRDLANCLKLQAAINARQKKSQPSDKLTAKLEKLIEQSSLLTQKIDSQIPLATISSELPIASKAKEISKALDSSQVVIVAGETGCGKTTQLPQICLNAGYGRRGLIGHTQPRRVAATSVARRIAEELNRPLGELVGYSIRFNNKLSDATRVKLMTDGILLSEIEADPMLSAYEVIIIDEAHERSLNIDFLLGFLKRILSKRKDLKIIITSATIDPQSFSQHFNNAPVILVEGRSYPVETRYRPLEDFADDNDNDDQVILGVINAVDECNAESRGDILIFADGEGQIKSICQKLNKLKLDKTIVLPLYSRLGQKEQQRIFEPNSQRKIIVATNVAETSLTVPGIIFVIDIGTARISRFSQRNKIQQLPVEKISQASAEQRKGRCGRVAPGICIRLYSEEDFNLRDAYTQPEINRTNLIAVVLKLKALKVKEITAFPFMNSPSDRAWNVAFNSLFELGALDKHQKITSIGEQMAKLPVDPQLARILVDKNLNAINEMLIICSLMSVREVRERPHDKQQKADLKHRQYEQGGSDILTAINLWNMLAVKKSELSSNQFKQWCRDNFINFLGWLEWRRVYSQLKESVEDLKLKVNQTSPHDDDIHKALIPGFVTHVFQKTQEAHYLGARGLKVWLHPSSLYFRKSPAWLISAEMIETEKLYARMNGQIKPEWIEQQVPHLLKSHYRDPHWRKKKGQVSAYLDQTFFGLPVVSKRLVNYSQVDPEKCREIFLQEGLASDQLNEDFPFLLANRQKIGELREQEQRQRVNSVLIEKGQLASLYDEKIPQEIVSVIQLKKWLKKDFKSRNRRLTFSVSQLTRNESTNIDEYPSTIKVKGVDLTLSYSFSPGTAEDGVTVEIPSKMIDQFTDRDFDWLVPGYLEEKVLATLKSLPKNKRRAFIPLSDTSKQCYELLVEKNNRSEKFTDALAKIAQRISGIQIKSSDFDMESIPAHLKMKFKLVDKQNSYQLLSFDEAKKLKKEVKVTAPQSKTIITDLPDNGFSIESYQSLGESKVRIFKGLSAEKGKVLEREFPTEQAALESHRWGVAQLVVDRSMTEVKRFIKSWPDRQKIERLNMRFGGFIPLANLLTMIVAADFLKDVHPVTKQATLAQVRHQFKIGFAKKLACLLNDIDTLLTQREKIYRWLSELVSPTYQVSKKDITQQLETLWSEKTIKTAAFELTERYSRYQSGILKRLKRIETNFPKEQQALDVYEEWQAWFDELSAHENHVKHHKQLAQRFWELQEYRLSLFSPGVKVVGNISAKKLQKSFELLESMLEQ